MTEQEWLLATDPKSMLEFLRGKASDRKLRLFACVCCRQLDPTLSDETVRTAIEVTEQWVDGTASQEELEAAWTAIQAVIYQPWMAGLEEHRALTIGESKLMIGERKRTWLRRIAKWSSNAVWPGAAFIAAEAPNDSWMLERVVVEEGWKRTLTCLLRDVFGPLLFRTITLAPAWLTWHGGLLVSMAQKMYDSRDFSDMPVLADALEEAGCTNPDILAHCRGSETHVRGCWIVDLLLGKE
jgi:hypothetical protein